MKLKSYFADSVEAAVSQARRELGADAMLVNSQRTSLEFRHLGHYEIVCAITSDTPSDSSPEGPPAVMPAKGQHLDKLSQEVSDLRQQMERLAATFSRSSAGMANLATHPQLATIFAQLTEAEIDSRLAHEIIERIGAEGSAYIARAELARLLSVDPSLGRPGVENRVVALVGPPGSGKTACLVKMAACFGIAARKPCHILTLDTQRVASTEQLRSYAAILGIGFQVLETTIALAQALQELRSKDLILIDTPGFSSSEMEDAGDMARFFSTLPAIDTHLVLSASMRQADMARIVDEYALFRPDKLFEPPLMLVANHSSVRPVLPTLLEASE
jgi:flagellar biosynthesis protein FlhF